MVDRNSVIHGNQIKDRTINQLEIDFTNTPSDGEIIQINMPTGDFTSKKLSAFQEYLKLQDNIMINAFRIAVNGSLTQFNMVDGIVDEYEDESGIDTVNSLNEDYNSTDDYYSPNSLILGIAPFAHMKMQNNTDDGTGANAVSNIGTPTYTAGKIIDALTLDGSTDALNLDALASDIQTDTKGSISFWFKADDQTADQMIFSVSDGSAVGPSMQMDYVGGNLKCYYNTGAGATTKWGVETSALGATIWWHIVLVQDGVSPVLYVNGVLDTTIIDSDDLTLWFSADASDLDQARIGCQAFNSSETFFFAGQIDDFRYYQNYALDSDEVDAIYNSGSGTEASQPGGAGVENMTLISESFTSEAEADTGRIVILEEDVDSVTLNTDLLAYASRDGGSSWVQGTLADEGDYDALKRILVANFDFTQSGVGSGTSMEYKLVTANTKDLKIHGTSLNWD